METARDNGSSHTSTAPPSNAIRATIQPTSGITTLGSGVGCCHKGMRSSSTLWRAFLRLASID